MNKTFRFVFLSYDDNENSVEIDAPNKLAAHNILNDTYTFKEVVSCKEV
jgi:hypothetical protein